MIRQLKIAHDPAVTGRPAALISMKAMLVHADNTLRRETNRMTPITLTRHLVALCPRNLETTSDSLRHALRSLARKWQQPDRMIYNWAFPAPTL
jgi:transposase